MKDLVFLFIFDAICFLLTIFFRSRLIKLKVNFENEAYFCILSVVIPITAAMISFNYRENKILAIILGVIFFILTYKNYIVASDYETYKEYKNRKD